MNEESEVVYSNDTYRVEKVGVKSSPDDIEYRYGVINNEYNVIEVETPILIQALKSADELEVEINKFYQEKSFESVGKSDIVTA